MNKISTDYVEHQEIVISLYFEKVKSYNVSPEMPRSQERKKLSQEEQSWSSLW